ncbi:MAG: hypothetical protein WC972_08415 [Trueperaceae bacterium]
MKLRHLATALLFGCLSVASAQCSRGPKTAEVTLPGFLAVYYQQFRSNALEDTAEFYGGVCVTAVGGEWTVLADHVLVGNLSTDIYLRAPEPTLYMAGWRMSGALLVADAQHLSLEEAKIVGPDASGKAALLEVDVASGEITLENLLLAGAAFQVSGTLATLQGEELTVEGADVTTCIGMESAPIALESDVATVALGSREVRLGGGVLRVGALRIALKEGLTLSDQTLSELEFPVKVATVEPSPPTTVPTPGAGLSVRVVGIPLADDVTLELGATGLDVPGQLLPVALLRVAPSDQASNTEATDPEGLGREPTRANATFGLEAGAPFLDANVTAPVNPWLTASFGARSGAAPARRARHEGRVGLTASAAVPDLGGSVVGEVFAAATALTANAATAQPDVAGPRLGVSVTAKAATPSLSAGGLPLGTLSLESRAQVTAYPVVWGSTAAGPATQWGVRLAPSWRLRTGPVTAALGYDARFTNSASPFGSSVDGLTPLQRATGSLVVEGPMGGGFSGRLELSAAYDPFATPVAVAGVKVLRADGRLELDAQPWTVTVKAALETAGLVNALPNVRAFADLDVSARRFGWPVVATHVPHGSFEFGVGGVYDLLGGELERLSARMAVPVAFENLELRPFVAVDFARALQGGSAYLSGYGLDLTFITCCGSFTLGALNDYGKWGVSVSVDLERRPGGGGGEAAPTSLAPVEGGGAAGEGNEAEPGIMPGTP